MDLLETCGLCNGFGEIICSNCHIGSIRCKKCYGSGSIRCEQCEGKGKIKGFLLSRQCGDCKGEGKIGCDVCNGKGEIKCHTCSGSGSIKCRLCEGNGKIPYKIFGNSIEQIKSFNIAETLHLLGQINDTIKVYKEEHTRGFATTRVGELTRIREKIKKMENDLQRVKKIGFDVRSAKVKCEKCHKENTPNLMNWCWHCQLWICHECGNSNQGPTCPNCDRKVNGVSKV